MIELIKQWTEWDGSFPPPLYLAFVWEMMLLFFPRQIGGEIYLAAYRRRVRKGDFDQVRKFSIAVFITVFQQTEEELERLFSDLVPSLEMGALWYQVFVIFDGVGYESLEVCERRARIAEKYGCYIEMATHRHKRKNMRALMRYAKEIWAQLGRRPELCAFLDSDTFLNLDTIWKLTRPFSDPRIGGVTPYQRVDNPVGWIAALADWLEDARARASMAFASIWRQIICLPGRLYVVRTEIVADYMEILALEILSIGMIFGKWFAWPMAGGDDRSISCEVHRRGFGSVLAPDALVTTQAPETIWGTILQWFRWRRSQFYYTITFPWLKHKRLLAMAFVGWGDLIVMLSSVGMIGVFMPYKFLFGHRHEALLVLLASYIIGSSATVVTRQIPHLSRHLKWYLWPKSRKRNRSQVAAEAFVLATTIVAAAYLLAAYQPYPLSLVNRREICGVLAASAAVLVWALAFTRAYLLVAEVWWNVLRLFTLISGFQVMMTIGQFVGLASLLTPNLIGKWWTRKGADDVDAFDGLREYAWVFRRDPVPYLVQWGLNKKFGVVQ